MLILSRKVDQSIVIGGPARITLIKILGDKVRLGVDAADDVSVDRDEIYQRKLAEGPIHGAPVVPAPIGTTRQGRRAARRAARKARSA
jgi:carbon storage regulator